MSAFDAILNDLLTYETDADNPADGRRVIRDERLALMAAIQQSERRRATGERGDTAWSVAFSAAREARRVLTMWGGK